MELSREAVAIRLIEERERLGYSLRDFAAKLGMSANGLRNYENGQRWVSGKFLMDAASFGVDVQYVLTGVPSQNRPEVEKKIGAEVNIRDSSNVVGVVQEGGVVNQINTNRHVTKVLAEVRPGAEHISESQAVRLTKLVKDVVEFEKKLKKSPKSFRAVWSALNSHMGVTRYRLIPSAGYEKAEKYLLQWIGRLNSMASASNKDENEWRKRKFAYIKINTRDDPSALDRYLAKNFGVTTIRDLSNDDLVRVYRYVAGRKRAKNR